VAINLESKSKLCVFGGFNSGNIDTIYRFRNHHVVGAWEGGLSSYPSTTVGTVLYAN